MRRALISAGVGAVLATLLWATLNTSVQPGTTAAFWKATDLSAATSLGNTCHWRDRLLYDAQTP